MITQPRSVLDIPIFHRIYDLYKLLHSYQAKIPKSERYTLWQKCQNTTLAPLEILIETGHRKGEGRVQSLYSISNKLDLLKVLIRLAKDTRTIDHIQYLEIQTVIQEIGKMIGGWIKVLPPLSFLSSAGKVTGFPQGPDTDVVVVVVVVVDVQAVRGEAPNNDQGTCADVHP